MLEVGDTVMILSPRESRMIGELMAGSSQQSAARWRGWGCRPRTNKPLALSPHDVYYELKVIAGAAPRDRREIMRTYSELTGEHPGMFFWSCDAGLVEDDFGNEVRGLDVLIYETEDDMDADTDNTLSIGRETVIDDREAMAVVREGDQTIGTWSMWTAPTRFLRELIEQAVENGEATAQDADGCTVTAVRQDGEQ